MNAELDFFIKVVRNGGILAGMYFVSVFATTNDLTFEICKPVLIFLLTYVLTELARHYKLNPQEIEKRKTTLFYGL